MGCLRRPQFRAPSAPLSGGTCGAPNDFKNVTRSMRIPNMCLVLKLDNGKVVSIANGQNHRWTESQIDRITEPPSTVLVYRYEYLRVMSFYVTYCDNLWLTLYVSRFVTVSQSVTLLCERVLIWDNNTKTFFPIKLIRT